MKCTKAQRLINDYVDDLLTINDIRSLKKHLAGCEECSELLNDFGNIVNDAQCMNDLNPSRDVWPEIQRGVSSRKRAGRFWGIFQFFQIFKLPSYSGGWSFALSALLIILVLAPVMYFGFLNTDESNNNQEKIALDHFNKAEEHYQAAIKALETAIEGKDKELSPELAEVFNKNLEIIDESIQVCRAAVEKQPDSPEANRFLLVCYRKKIELLNEIKELTMKS